MDVKSPTGHGVCDGRRAGMTRDAVQPCQTGVLGCGGDHHHDAARWHARVLLAGAFGRTLRPPGDGLSKRQCQQRAFFD
jgi:hypothetical protein